MTEEEFSDLLRGLDALIESLARAVEDEGLLPEEVTPAAWLEAEER